MKKFFIPLVLLIAVNIEASYYSKGCTAYTYKNYDKAITYFTKAVEINPKDGNSYYFLGEVYKIQENYPKAIECFQLAIQGRISQKYLKLAYWNLIVLSEQNGNIEEVVRSCRIFWEKTKDKGAYNKVNDIVSKMLWTSNEKAKAIYREGKQLERMKKNDEAYEKYKAALAEDSSFMAARYEIGMYYYKNDNIDTAVSYFRTISDAIPFYTAVNLLTANIYFSNQSFSTALKYYTNVVEYGFLGKSTKYNVHLKRGSCYFKNSDYKKAAEDIEICRNLYRSRTKPLYLLSAIYIKDGKYQEAAVILERLNRIKPGNEQVLFQLGSIYYKEDNKKFAIYFDKLFDLTYKNKKEPTNSQIKAFLILADYHYKNKAYRRTAQIINYLPESTRNYDTNLMLANSYYYNNKYIEAIAVYETLSLDSDTKLLLAKSYFKSGNKTMGINYLVQEIKYSSTFKPKVESDSYLGKYIAEVEKKIESEKESTSVTTDNNSENPHTSSNTPVSETPASEQEPTNTEETDQ